MSASKLPLHAWGHQCTEQDHGAVWVAWAQVQGPKQHLLPGPAIRSSRGAARHPEQRRQGATGACFRLSSQSLIREKP